MAKSPEVPVVFDLPVSLGGWKSLLVIAADQLASRVELFHPNCMMDGWFVGCLRKQKSQPVVHEAVQDRGYYHLLCQISWKQTSHWLEQLEHQKFLWINQNLMAEFDCNSHNLWGRFFVPDLKMFLHPTEF